MHTAFQCAEKIVIYSSTFHTTERVMIIREAGLYGTTGARFVGYDQTFILSDRRYLSPARPCNKPLKL